jgi:hypothetical protein
MSHRLICGRAVAVLFDRTRVRPNPAMGQADDARALEGTYFFTTSTFDCSW